MKRENGLGTIGVIILIIFIIASIGTIYYYIQKSNEETEKSDIYSNMLLIQGACKVFKESSTANKEEDALVGIKLSEFKDNENENENNEGEDEEQNKVDEENEKKEDQIISNFKKTEVISSEDYEKYYVLTDEDLSKLNIDVKNEKDCYYLINYDSNEVIITKGYQGKYKLSEFE